MVNHIADAPPGYLTIEAAAARLGMRTDELRARVVRGEVHAEPTFPRKPCQCFGRWVISSRTIEALILKHYAACIAAQIPIERT